MKVKRENFDGDSLIIKGINYNSNELVSNYYNFVGILQAVQDRAQTEKKLKTSKVKLTEIVY